MEDDTPILKGTVAEQTIITRLQKYLTTAFYSFGIFGVYKKRFEEYIYFFPISAIEGAVWEFRWLFTGLLGVGMSYTLKGSFPWEWQVNLPPEHWRKVRRFTWFLVATLFGVWTFSIICFLSQIDFDLTRCDNGRGCLLDAVFTFLDRVFTFPLFLCFGVFAYTLGTVVEEYGKRLQSWPQESPDNGCEEMTKCPGEDGAREEFLKIKRLIRSVGASFQLYLAVHFLLLFCTFFLGICSCFEQMEVRISENVTMESPFLLPRYARAINFTNTESSAGVMASASSLYAVHKGDKAEFSQTSQNASLKNVNDLLQIKWIKREMHMLITDMLVKTMESLLLYLMPLYLMARLKNRLRCVKETIEDSDRRVQAKESYIFSDIATIKSMCKYVQTISGIKIYNIELPGLSSLILAAFGPFIAVIVHRLLSYIHMSKK